MDKMISISEVAEHLGVSEDNIALWASQNGIPTYYEADHLRRFKRPAIDKWLETRRTTETTDSESGKTFNEKVKECSERVLKFLKDNDKRPWIVEDIARELDEYVPVVHGAARNLVAFNMCEMQEMFIAGRTMDTITIKKGR